MTTPSERARRQKASVPMPVVGGAYARFVNEACSWGVGSVTGGTAIGAVSMNWYRASTATAALIAREVEAPLIATPWRAPLDEIRESLAASVAQVSEALGVTRQAYYAWLRGAKVPAPENQKRIGQLRGAAAQLKEALGPRLGIYLNYPIGPEDETYWELLAKSDPVKEATAVLLATALRSIERRRANERALSDEGDR